MLSCTVENSAAVTLPYETEGALPWEGSKCFSFETNAGAWYNIDEMYDSTSMTVFDGDGNTIPVRSRSYGWPASWQAEVDERVFLQITHANVRPSFFSDYSLSVDIAVDNDGNTRENATTIALPSSTTAGLDYVGDKDFFSFAAVAGQVYRFSTPRAESASRYLRPVFSLTDEFGDSQSLVESGEGLKNWLAPRSGEYFVEVGQYYNNSRIGEYSLDIVQVDYADDHRSLRELATRRLLPAKVEAELEVAGEADWFSFSATTGFIYEISVSGTDDSVRLVDTNGQTVVEAERGRPFIWAPPSGEHYVEVRDTDGEGDSAYAIEINETTYVDDHSNAAQQATPLNVSKQKFGQIEVAGDADYFEFSAAAGTRYNIMSDTNSCTERTLYEPDGVTEIQSLSNELGCTTMLSWVAPSDEAYLVAVRSDHVDQIGPYFLTVDVAVDDHPETIAEATPFTTNAASGNIDYRDDKDVFSFDALAGTTYSIAVSWTGPSGFRPYMNLTDSDGNRIRGTASSNGDLVSLQWWAPIDGPYFLEIGGGYRTQLGRYDIQLTTDPGDDHGNLPEFATTIDMGTEIAGEFEIVDDHDVFAFTAIADQRYAFRWSHAYVQVHDSAGQSSTRWRQSTAEATWVAPNNGTYYLTLYEYWSARPKYTLAVDVQPDDHGDTPINATPIAVSQPTDVKIDFSGDHDVLSWSATAGRLYEIQFSSRYGLPIWILDSTGSIVSSHREWVAPLDAVYYIETSWYGSSSSSSSLPEVTLTVVEKEHVDDHKDLANATRVNAPSIVQGELEIIDDEDWFSFSAIAGTHYTFRVDRIQPLGGTLLQLFDSDGTTLLTSDIEHDGHNYDIYVPTAFGNSSLLSWTAPTNGDFFLALEAYDVGGWWPLKGSYQIRIDGTAADGSPLAMPGDANFDGRVDSIDLGLLLNGANGNKGVNSTELGLLLSNFRSNFPRVAPVVSSVRAPTDNTEIAEDEAFATAAFQLEFNKEEEEQDRALAWNWY